MFGNNETEDPVKMAEEGLKRLPSTSPEPVADVSTGQYCMNLMFCVVGLQTAYLTWGVLQVSH